MNLIIWRWEPTLPTTIVHRVTGIIGHAEAAQGAAAALGVVQARFASHGPLRLLLDLRGMTFANLQAHKTWSQGFARNPALAGMVHHVAIVGSDTSAQRTEQELLTTEQLRFFVAPAEAERWLATTDVPSSS